MMITEMNKTVVSPEIHRLLSAAIVSDNFRELLLREPVTAVRTGFQGEFFHLSDRELACLLDVTAYDLADFTAQMLANLHFFPSDFAVDIAAHESLHAIPVTRLYS